MAFFKQVWQFESPPGGFFNEVYYVEVDTLDAAARISERQLLARLAILHPNNRLKKIRISDISKPRVSTIKTVNRSGNDAVDGDEGPANLDEAVVINLASSVVPSSRKLWLRGTAENDVRRNQLTGLDHVAADFRPRLDAWIGVLSNDTSTYVILTRQRIGAGGIVKARITKVEGNARPGYSKVTFDVNPGVDVDDKMVFNHVSQKLLPGLKGIFQIVAKDGLTVTIKYGTPRNIDDAAIQEGYGYKLAYRTGAKLNNSLCGFAYLGSRRSKNVDTGSRGARRAAKLR